MKASAASSAAQLKEAAAELRAKTRECTKRQRRNEQLEGQVDLFVAQLAAQQKRICDMMAGDAAPAERAAAPAPAELAAQEAELVTEAEAEVEQAEAAEAELGAEVGVAEEAEVADRPSASEPEPEPVEEPQEEATATSTAPTRRTRGREVKAPSAWWQGADEPAAKPADGPATKPGPAARKAKSGGKGAKAAAPKSKASKAAKKSVPAAKAAEPAAGRTRKLSDVDPCADEEAMEAESALKKGLPAAAPLQAAAVSRKPNFASALQQIELSQVNAKPPAAPKEKKRRLFTGPGRAATDLLDL